MTQTDKKPNIFKRFWRLYKNPWENMLTINGRVKRKEYWTFKLTNLVILLIILSIWIVALIKALDDNNMMIWATLASFVLAIFGICAFVANTTMLIRRFHDVNLTTNVAIIFIVLKYASGPFTIIGGIITFIISLLPTDSQFVQKLTKKDQTKKAHD